MFSYFRSKKNKDSKKKDKEISLIVENVPPQEPFVAKVAKSLLVKHSTVFKKMDDSGHFKRSREVKLEAVTVTGVQKMIEYILTESVFFHNHLEVIETLKAAYVYQVTAMNDICLNFLITVIDRENVCDIYEFVSSYSHHQMEYHCLQFIDRHAVYILASRGFFTLKKFSAEDIIKRQTLDVPTELVVFRAVLTWGLNDCLRRGADSENLDQVLRSVNPLLEHVKFAAMTDQDMEDPDVASFYKILRAEDTRRIYQRSESRTRSTDSSNFNQREYVQNYNYDLEMVNRDEHSVRNGETFCLRVEVLKGRVFLTGVTLAFDRFVNTKGNSCLYVALSVTNVQSADQVCARGTFSDVDAEIKFPSPLLVKESEGVEMALNVKRAVNVCSMLMKADSQIAVSERKDVVLKIVPSSTTGSVGRSMFKSIGYFY